ncbi:hypothetical protein [Pseudomonas sp. RIT-PI-AD]|uniref:hypothetical protein n=1 Tax=Pseudomonas sp. RIT-PI-AD TaxID=3035294 RepID=UPI0021D8D7DC|nr:hypothetical protein [Pseudomonas sp. RIT-PI-AD]
MKAVNQFKFAILPFALLAASAAQATGMLITTEDEFVKQIDDKWVQVEPHTYRLETESSSTEIGFGEAAAEKYLAYLRSLDEEAATKASANGNGVQETIQALEADLAQKSSKAAKVVVDGPSACGQGWTLNIDPHVGLGNLNLSTENFFAPVGPFAPKPVTLYSTSTIYGSGNPAPDSNSKTTVLNSEDFGSVTSNVLSVAFAGTWYSYGAVRNQNCTGSSSFVSVSRTGSF